MTRFLPDQRKILDVLGHLDDSVLNRMIAVEFGDELSRKIDGINSILSKFKKNDLLIIENWCKSHGRAELKEITLMKGNK